MACDSAWTLPVGRVRGGSWWLQVNMKLCRRNRFDSLFMGRESLSMGVSLPSQWYTLLNDNLSTLHTYLALQELDDGRCVYSSRPRPCRV